MLRLFSAAVLAAACPWLQNAHAQAIDIAGVWLTADQDAHVEIEDCGDGTPCGTLAWVDPATTETDLDARNKDKSLRSRPLVGLDMVWGFERAGDVWRRGRIYNPEDGRTFRSALSLETDGRLKVKGCVGPFCQTQYWTRIDDQVEQTS